MGTRGFGMHESVHFRSFGVVCEGYGVNENVLIGACQVVAVSGYLGLIGRSVRIEMHIILMRLLDR
jgi:hypothetical protein